jgi:hypothetical protein
MYADFMYFRGTTSYTTLVAVVDLWFGIYFSYCVWKVGTSE